LAASAVVLLLAAPDLIASPAALHLLSQVGIAVLVCASYGLLLGHTGLLSFGHAVYPALGAYAGVYLLRYLADVGGGHPLSVALVPLAGGLGALLAALALGWAQARHAGTVFGMVTLGVGELFYALALVFSSVSGGEGGITANRVQGPPVLGIRWSNAQEMLGLVAVYLGGGLLLYRWLLLSVPGHLMHAVRDNARRVAFTGVNPVGIRFVALLASAFLAGMAGGLGALLFEMATPDAFSTHRSAQYLVFAVLGGVGSMQGAVIGGVLMVFATVWLSTQTAAWMFYTGVAFCAVVLLSPGGVAQLLGSMRAVRHWQAALATAVGLALACAGVVVLTELIYHHSNLTQVASGFALWGLGWNPSSWLDWMVGLALLCAGALVGWQGRRGNQTCA